MSNITSLVSDAPPGELDAVRHDIELLAGKSAAVKRDLERDITKANLAQYRVVEVNKKLSLLSKYNQIDDTTFFTAGTAPKKFEVNHLTRETKVIGEYEAPVDTSKYQRKVESYVAEHYSAESVAAVFPLNPDNATSDELVIAIIGRKLNPQNFFNGQMNSVYSLIDGELSGTIKVDVHYFEEGNVRLDSSKKVKSSVKVTASNIGSTLRDIENKFEDELHDTLVSLNESEFKSLRRQLPITRQPMVWGKAVAGYKLGKELENR